MKLDQIASKPVSIANPGDTLNMAIQRMHLGECEHLPVVSDGRLVGMISERDVLIHAYGDGYAAHELAHVDPKKVLGSSRVDAIMSSPVHSLSPGEPVEAAARLMLHKRIHAIPLAKHDFLFGIVTESDLLRCFFGYQASVVSEELANSNVSQHMATHVFSVGKDDLKPTVVRLMRDKGIRHVPVVDDDRGLVGILSESDVLFGSRIDRGYTYVVPRKPEQPHQFAVTDLMSTELVAITCSHTMREAAKVMVDTKISCVPILADGSLAGIITSTDLLRGLTFAFA